MEVIVTKPDEQSEQTDPIIRSIIEPLISSIVDISQVTEIHPNLPDICLIVSCHDMVAELLAHLDIMSFCHLPHHIIVIHSGKHNIKHLVQPHHYCHIEPKGHSLGAVLALTAGLRIAKDKGYRYICFRNGDDWVLNHQRIEFVLSKLKEGYKLAGYNWFGKNSYDDFALNELYIDMNVVNKLDLNFWDNEFIKKVKKDCEKHFARMIKSVVVNKEIFKLSDRERGGGVGMAFANSDNLNNNRWFNMDWQLIGDHNDNDRRYHWERIKHMVPYADMLLHKNFFKCWHDRIQIF